MLQNEPEIKDYRQIVKLTKSNLISQEHSDFKKALLNNHEFYEEYSSERYLYLISHRFDFVVLAAMNSVTENLIHKANLAKGVRLITPDEKGKLKIKKISNK